LDKKALLDELKIDRDAVETPGRGPFRWLLLGAIVGGIAFVAFVVEFPGAEALPVKTAIAQSAAQQVASGSSVLDATGYVVARRQATVSAKVTGKVVLVLIEEGMAVKEGQLLAKLDDSVPRAELMLAESRLVAAKAALDELEVAVEQARLDFERTTGLAAKKLASQADLDRDRLALDAGTARLERARKDVVVAEQALAVQRQLVADMEIRAPFSGVVVAKAAQPGEMISPISAGGGFTRTGICSIVDMDSLEVEVDVNEAYINRVKPKQPVEVTLNAYPDYRIPADVIAIIPTADRNKATVRVRIALLERDPRVLPDMGVRVSFLEEKTAEQQPAAAPSGVLVPSSAAHEDERGAYVFVVDGDRARRRPIVIGERKREVVRVTSGVAVGERVIADAVEGLADGAKIDTETKGS
jgi:RND family efflux transporter MFP subunit